MTDPYRLDYGFAQIDGPAQWRFPVAFQLSFSFVTLSLLFFLPESPRWLAKHGDKEKSTAVIARLIGDVSTGDPKVIDSYEAIQRAIRLESAGGPFKFKELFEGGKLQNFRRTILCIAVDGFSQLSGINLITYYAPVIFQSIGLSRDLALLIAGFNATEYLLASLIPIWIIEKTGRRRLMLTGSAGQAVSMMVLAICVRDGGKGGRLCCLCLLVPLQHLLFMGLAYRKLWYSPHRIRILLTRADSMALRSRSLYSSYPPKGRCSRFCSLLDLQLPRR